MVESLIVVHIAEGSSGRHDRLLSPAVKDDNDKFSLPQIRPRLFVNGRSSPQRSGQNHRYCFCRLIDEEPELIPC